MKELRFGKEGKSPIQVEKELKKGTRLWEQICYGQWAKILPHSGTSVALIKEKKKGCSRKSSGGSIQGVVEMPRRNWRIGGGGRAPVPLMYNLYQGKKGIKKEITSKAWVRKIHFLRQTGRHAKTLREEK